MKKQLHILLFALLFSSSFNSYSQTPICGGTFTDPAGPNANYANDSDYTVTIFPTSPGEQVTVTFTAFDIEATWDALYIFDGNSITSPQLASTNPAANVPGGLAGGYWGTIAPGSFTSTHPSGALTFRFRSDNVVNGAGWIANVTCGPMDQCPSPILLTATYITTNSVVLGWQNVGSNANSWQYIALPCGSPAPTAATTGWIPAPTNPFTVNGLNSSTCYTFYVRALCGSISGNSVWSQPITVTTLQIPPACGGTFTDAAGPNANYANNSDSTVTICPTNPGEMVTVTFTAFNTEANWDALYVFNGNSITSSQIASTNAASNVPGGLAGGFWGTTIPGPFTSSDPTGCLTFRFRSDPSINRAGWIANVTCAPPPTCPSPTQLVVTNITANSAVVGWTNNGTGTLWHVLALPCGSPAPTAATTGWTAATVNPFMVTGLNSATCYNFYVRAICSNGTDIGPWSNFVTVTTLTATPVCGGNFIDNGGLTANYLPNTDSTVTICPTIAGQIVTVTFTSFNTETLWDALYIFDGPTISSPQIASANPAGNVPGSLPGGFWGNAIPGPFTSTDQSGCLTFRFRSDGSVQNPGWLANITCSPPPTCPRPTALVTSNPTINSVTLGWTNNSTATLFEVVALPCNTLPTDTTVGTQTSLNPFTIPGLAPSTCYNLFVRAICSDTDSSLWSVALPFTTLSIPPVCGGNYIDNGGLNANYLNNSDSTVTICPTVPGDVVTVTFTAFNVEATWDALYVYDGNSLASPQITSSNPTGNVPGGVSGGYWGNAIPGPFTSSDPTGCLTFRFRSDNTVNNPGWNSNVTCGPAVDKIQLVAFVDQNSNGIKDSNENFYSNGSFVYQQNNTGPSTNAYSPTGRYDLLDDNPTNTYDFSYQIQAEFMAYYSSGTTSFNDINIPIGSGTNVLYFPITLTQSYNDVTISIVPLSPPRPGLTYINRIVYKNIGLTAANGNITFTKPTPVAITNVSQSGAVITATGYTYAFTNLMPNETRFFNVTMSVPSSPTVVINDVLTASATITAPANDINLTNNTSNSSQIVVNSYDPNDKMEAHGDEIPFSQFAPTDYLFYTIRFQNNGTANAIDVRIEDVLDSLLDPTSIRMVSSSHNYTMNRINNTISWDFRNIQLVPASVSQVMSMGYIYFKIRLYPGFVAGDLVSNNASIFFDSNPPIVTNTFDTKFVTLLGTVDNVIGNFVMYPNPTNNLVHISMQNTSDTIESVSITDVLGKTITSSNRLNSNETTLDVSNLAKGIYMVEITTTDKQKSTKKLVIN